MKRFLGAIAAFATPLADTPRPILDKLSSSLKKALGSETVRERYRSMGVEIIDSTQAEFAAFVRADLEKWRRVAREGNIVGS